MILELNVAKGFSRYGYIGDVTSAKERTAIIAVLGALGFVMMPLADFCGGQIYQLWGFLPVYIVSLCFVFLGVLYIWFIPESISARSHMKKKESEEMEDKPHFISEHFFKRVWNLFKQSNNVFLDTFKYVFR